MHKNPFVPPPAYPHQQPPLPPGPPPQPSGQPDYSAYWQHQAAAGQHQPGQPPYNPQWQNPGAQWSAMQPPQQATPVKPPVEQQALYANYGYGQQNVHWQQQRNQQAQYAQPPAPPAHAPMPPPIAPQAQYNPYQPQAGAAYAQPYVPQPVGIPTQAASPYIPTQPGHPPYFNNQQRPPPPQQQTSPQQPPPAKRQRFDNSLPQNSPQARFQPPPPPPMAHHAGPPHGPNRPPGPGMNQQGPSNNSAGGHFGGGAGRGGMGGSSGAGRGGPPMNRGGGGGGGGRGGGGGGGSMHGPRAMGMNRGGNRSGGSAFNSGGRSGGGGGQGNLRNQGSRDRNFNNSFNRRSGGGGSFGGHHQGNSSFRGGGGGGRSGPMGFNHGRSGRHDHHQNKNSVPFGSNMPRKEENRRTLTDFKIIGIHIEDLAWSWGTTSPAEKGPEQKIEITDRDDLDVKVEDVVTSSAIKSESEDEKPTTGIKQEPTVIISENTPTAPTARLRIYFHTPPNADDEKPIASLQPTDTRKGKRKKLDDDDDDGDSDSGSGPRPPPVPEGHPSHERQSSVAASVAASTDREMRGSVAPSVAETASEADWLMAAMTEGDGDAGDVDAEGEIDESYVMTQVDHDMNADGEYDIDESSMDSGYKHAELMVTESTGIASNGPGTHESTVAADPVVDGAAYKTSTDEVEQLVMTSLNSDVKQEIVDDAIGESAQAETSLMPGMGSYKSVSVDGHETIGEVPVVAPEDGDDLTLLESEVTAADEPIVHATVTEGQGPQKEEHLPEPPASPVSNTVASSSSTGTTNPEGTSIPASTTKAISANRLSISYASGTRRLLIDAGIVEKMTVMRSEGRVEVLMTIERLADALKGILVEVLNDETNSYSSLTGLSEVSGSDVTLPPFWKLTSPTKVMMKVYLDKEKPLTEPKWVKTGDVQEWLREQFGGRFWVAGDAVGWEKRIEVTNPEPAQTLHDVMENWASNSAVGATAERQRFLKNHMSRSDNVLEILLRLVRGERATASTQGTNQISAPSVTGPLLHAMEAGSYHSSQQTHVSLAVVAFARLAEGYAESLLGEGKGKAEVEEKISEIIRHVPHHLIFKSLDGMMKEWRSDKKHPRS